MLDCGYGLPVVLWVCGGCEFLCDGGGSVGCRHGVWPCGLPACVVAEVWGKKKGYGRVGCQYVCWESVGKKLIF